MSSSGRLFFAGLVLVILALVGMTGSSLYMEAQERVAREDARHEQVLSQALLRIDLTMAPLLAGEAARWQAVLTRGSETWYFGSRELAADPATRDWISHPARVRPDLEAWMLRSPMRPFLQHYFEVDKKGNVGWPGLVRPEPEGAAVGEVLASLVTPERLRTLLQARVDPVASPFHLPAQNIDPGSFEGRTQMLQNFQQNTTPVRMPVMVGEFTAGFLRDQSGVDQLLLVRTVQNCPWCQMHGLVVDWSRLEEWLCQQVGDLLPLARLRPATEGHDGRRLASLPAMLEPGQLEPMQEALVTPMRGMLLAIWIVAALALAVVIQALRASNELSARRALFVSSVTHELRTPLTTFRMYSQMLADGMVPAESHGEYLETLKSESQRLARIVESVLLYARLEEGQAGAHRINIGADVLLARVVPQLEQRALDAQCQLVVDLAGLDGLCLHVDPQAIEQILLNLVDNACKYAAGSPIRVHAVVHGAELRVGVSDQGAGVRPEEASRIFEPFQRGFLGRDGNVPGLGMGLAIARGLARAMQGELALVRREGVGTTFELRLPGTLEP